MRATSWRFGSVVVLLLLNAVSGNATATLVTDNFDLPPSAPRSTRQFGTPPTPAVVAGGPTGDFFRLNYDVDGGREGYVIYDRVYSGAARYLSLSFDFLIIKQSYVGSVVGDGVGFAFVPTGVAGVTGPSVGPRWNGTTGFNGVVSIGLDMANNRATMRSMNDAKTISPGVSMANGLWHHVDFSAVFTGGNVVIDLSFDGNNVVNDLVMVGQPAYESRLQFSAFTGAAYANHDIDNIVAQWEVSAQQRHRSSRRLPHSWHGGRVDHNTMLGHQDRIVAQRRIDIEKPSRHRMRHTLSVCR